ncbi:MAG: TetR/AcrR family transcriptional regulator [Acidimicrobiales bacterium]|nr:TetR/AcrR family transcriptional regulator [Acidimicrobiales bacterium]
MRRATTRRRLDPERRREQIIDAAERVFHGRDPSEVTFEQVAEAAGVSRALVYNYFGDKGGLMAAMYLRNFQRLDDALAEAMQDVASPQERLRAIIRCYLDFARTNEACWAVISCTEVRSHPLVQAARARRYDRMASAWGSTPEGRLLARSIIGLLEAATFDWLEHRDVETAQVERLLYAVLWSGLSGLHHHGVRLPRTRRPQRGRVDDSVVALTT